ncbi:MAG: N-acetylmuramoyl-L-alanine amidase family protein, partial [Enterocloster sp.]
MKQTLKNMRIRKWMGVLFAAVLMTVLGAQTALASTDYVKSISITLDVAPVPGEDLPDLHYGYTGDLGREVKIPSNERYEIVSAEWGSKIDEAKLGGTYTIKITLETINDYRFNSSYSSSKVTVRGGDFVSAKRQGSGKLLVTVKTDPAEGSLDEPEEVYWSSGKYTSSKFGYADWEKVEDAAYDVYLYRGSKTVKKVTDLHTSSYNFYPYMTSEGTYTFRVRAVPADDSVSKYAKKSDWVTSDELYVDEDEVSDGSGQDK